MKKENETMSLILADDPRIVALDAAVKTSALQTKTENPFARMISIANTMATLRANLDEQVMAAVMMLQGSSIGFRTDKDKEGGYPLQIVRDVTIEAAFWGLSPVGNQFNILAGRFYCTKEGFKQLLDNIAGLKWFIVPGNLKQVANGTEVPVHVKYTLNGKTQELDWTFPVRVNAGMGADGVLGKAERKARKRLYEFITGVELADGEVEQETNGGEARPSRIIKKAEAVEIEEENAEEKTISAPKLEAALREKSTLITTNDIVEYCAATRTIFDEDRALENLDAVVAAVEAWIQNGRA